MTKAPAHDRRRQPRRQHSDRRQDAHLRAMITSPLLDRFLSEVHGDSDDAVEAWIDRMHEAINAEWRSRGWVPIDEQG